MKTISYLMVVWSTLGCGRGARAASQFNGDSALAYVARQLSFGPRIPNTTGHRAAGDWLIERLSASADTVVVQAFRHVTATGDTLALRNILARIRPELSERVLFLAHWDTRPLADRSSNLADRRRPVPGANDGASGVAVLVRLAEELQKNPPVFGVDLLLVDGEDYGDFTEDRDVLLGSRYFAEHQPEGYPPLFGVLLDMVGDRNSTFLREWNSVNRAPEVVQRVWRTADALGYRRVFRDDVGGAVTDDHVPLLDAGIRTIDIIPSPFPSYHHTVDDTLDKIDARMLEIVGNVAVALVH